MCADCVQLQLYGDARARWAGATSKAALSLDGYLGCEAGFTLDKHSHTLALVCRDHTAVLAFETRERLMQWQVKLQAHVAGARQWLVVVARGSRLAAGPARLLLRAPHAALVAGVPPRLLAVWELSHLRRYGAAQGRFCLEGGVRCGRGAGLHVLVTDQAAEIAREFECASRGNVSPTRWFAVFKKNEGAENSRTQPAHGSAPSTAQRARPPADLRLYEEPCAEDAGAVSPYWPSAERTHYQDMGLGDTVSVSDAEGTGCGSGAGSAWGGAQLQRCRSCMCKLGAMSRSSTAALTPGAKHFSPAWTMDALNENIQSYNVQNDNGVGDNIESCEALPVVNKTEEVCRCSDTPPRRPAKQTELVLDVSSAPRCARSRSHSQLSAFTEKIGPYENYDVPKVPSAEQIDGEYYDTPKRLKECLNRELFKITRSSTTDTLVFKKPCGCLLKLGKKSKEPTIVDCEENFEVANCPCRRVTDWAQAWIRLPYCRRDTNAIEKPAPNKENSAPSDGPNALYATVDLSQKTRRKSQLQECPPTNEHQTCDAEIDDGPLANYENLSFALSLEHYENAKDLLRKVGITESELDAIGANLKPFSLAKISKNSVCLKCGHRRSDTGLVGSCGGAQSGGTDEYLMMEPSSLDSDRLRDRTLAAGYTPMSPIGSFAFHTLKYPVKSSINRLLEEKSASNPALCPDKTNNVCAEESSEGRASGDEKDGRRRARGRRSSSVDSSRFLEDVEEFEGSVGSGGSATSMETLRDLSGSRARAACACTARGAGARGGARGGAAAAGARDSCSSNDSGVSSWSLRSAAPIAPLRMHRGNREVSMHLSSIQT
ncbi:Protein Dok-7 [Papilio xuthus]|uniref:Protein Dok-7 n=1 Tax=Papilio xuthus TaxID=66420 RepID=A0A194Q306_PAPXU|nr:Protein Dok-7 [Papilio xuthus]